MSDVDIYPVGLLHDMKHLRGRWWTEGRRVALARFGREVRRSWRRRGYWNGYLAEAHTSLGPRAGHGWTKARARLDLGRIVTRETTR